MTTSNRASSQREAAVWFSVFSSVGGARLPWLTLFVRRRRVRPKASIVFACVLLIATGGCVPLNYGVFISTLDEDVTLEVRNLQVDGFGSARRFKISRRGEKKIDYCIPEVTALDTSGHVIFRQVLPVLRPEIDNFQKPGEKNIYFLLTREGAYPICVAWRDRWRDHISEIVANYDVRAARQRLVREGALKE